MVKIYHPNKKQKPEFEQSGPHNVNINDIHITDCCGELTPFSIKKINDKTFSSERESTGQGLKAVICIPYQNAVILTQEKGKLLIGRNCKYIHNIQVYEDFVSQHPNLVKRLVS